MKITAVDPEFPGRCRTVTVVPGECALDVAPLEVLEHIDAEIIIK